jgi:hypothetical protein
MAEETDSVNASCGVTKLPVAWRKCAPVFCSLKEVMSETLANELQQKEMDSPVRQVTYVYYGISV